MNCIDKMYKEIEEILQKEKAEFEKLAVPVREIKHGFSDEDFFVTEPTEKPQVDYLAQIELTPEWDKKYFDDNKAKSFITFIFKKYLCFNKITSGETDFINGLEKSLSESTDLLETLKKAHNDFIDVVGFESEELKSFFTNPYNALFRDEKGYFAVIKKGKFSDIKRPFGFNANQMKKIIKETFDEYLVDYKDKFPSEKVYNAFVNGFKAEVNKSTLDPLELQADCTNKLLAVLSSNGVKEAMFNKYLEEKGLILIKQGNFYFRKKAYEEYAEYKKIEFRY